MKDPKRYGHKAIIYPKANDDTYITIPVEDTDGKWIAYDHYARIKAEVEAHEKRWSESEDLISHYKQQRDEAINDCECSRLKAEVERLRASSFVTAIPVEEYEKLKAENERLRKAGDAMEEVIWLNGCLSGMEIKERAVKAWNAAKEGKPSV